MIFDTLANRAHYDHLHPRLRLGFDFLEAFDPNSPDGRFPIEGERVFALVQSYETGPSADRRFEIHRRYIDLQYVVAGRERILRAPGEGLEVEVPYDEERDAEFYHDPPASSSVLLIPGDFAILFPGEAHKNGCMAGARDPVRKIVIKIEAGG
ncbi:MAG TPA: YhcH/YjgK/YiaL family protein [Longimicrobiaceae bacterium]